MKKSALQQPEYTTLGKVCGTVEVIVRSVPDQRCIQYVNYEPKSAGK